jgi:hypothetical protein
MFRDEIDNGSKVTIQGVTMWLPPFGIGADVDTGELKPVEIIKRSEKANEQFWERPRLEDDYPLLLEDEKRKQEIDSSYFNFELEKIRQREWHRRLYGVWVWINGKPVYFTGTYYFFLTYWMLDEGFPTHKRTDWEKFIYWQYCVFHPYSYGMIEVTKRRGGKSVIAACILVEYISRTLKSFGGIQSKTDEDAKAFFDVHVVTPFQSLIEIFQPLYDTNKGTKPEKVLSFYAASARGKSNVGVSNDEQLKSLIDFRNSKINAYDGSKLKRLILDERAKLDVDIIEGHLVVRKCLLDWRMNIVGKMLVCSTVEEIGIKSKFDQLWKRSDPSKLNDKGTTASGLFKFFQPADLAGDCDIYGEPLREKNLSVILQNRKDLEEQGDTKGLIEEIRKDPLSEREAFMLLNANSHFDVLLLNELYDDSKSRETSVLDYGNYVWEDGMPYTKAVWHSCDKQNARWVRPKNFVIPDGEKVYKQGSLFLPKNHIQFIAGCDPFQNSITESSVSSKASSGVLNRYEEGTNDEIYNKMFVCKYLARPPIAKLFHMDMVLQCFAYGCQLLVEAKMDGGLRDFFIDNNCEAFLIRIGDKANYGVDPNSDNKVLLVNLWEDYILTHGKQGKLIYPSVIHQLSSFNVNETEVSDEVMGLGWTLVADYYKKANFKRKGTPVDINTIFRRA